MRLRSALAAAAVTLGLVATTSHAGGTVSLDGNRRRHAAFSGNLNGPAISVDSERVRTDVDPLTARTSDCRADTCDMTQLRLTLPKGSTTGSFQVAVTAERELHLAIGLYDSQGRARQYSDVRNPCCEQQMTDLYPVRTSYTMTLTVNRLPPGRYTLVVFDRAGLGRFTAKVDYVAWRPDRKK